MLVNGSSVGPDSTYTFGNLTANATIEALFKLQNAGINELTMDNGQLIMKIYPNPVENYLNLEFIKSPVTPYTIKLYNSLGKLVLQKQSHFNSKQILNLSGYSKGLYILSITLNDYARYILKKLWLNRPNRF